MIPQGFDNYYDQQLSRSPTKPNGNNASSRNTAPVPARLEPSTQTTTTPTIANRKINSLNSLSDRYRRQAIGQHNFPLDNSGYSLLDPEARYGDAFELEKNFYSQDEPYRVGHDSAVVISSGRVSPLEDMILSLTKEAVQGLSVLEEEDTVKDAVIFSNGNGVMRTASVRERFKVGGGGGGGGGGGAGTDMYKVEVQEKQVEDKEEDDDQEREHDRSLWELDGAIKEAERKVTLSFF